ncbi:SAF domain-containing protein [Parenemella sanctibonifatiensis]|uniref:SAF domain-containing protein n=1 Tax=Parenemella sanctibonifatiensis TaxID=2016505 RepID=A0A255EC03_9ACTN|nr:SAF domain-containing protein [Parenemella sanctibonifatiensis]OYN88451.1 hypothetical protein CGZ92_04220 [Parenemella sanctibonifatiensis]
MTSLTRSSHPSSSHSPGPGHSSGPTGRGPVGGPGRLWRTVTRWWAWHRRLASALLAGLAVLVSLTILTPAPDATAPAVRVRADVPATRALTAADLEVVELPAYALPREHLTDPNDAIGLLPTSPLIAGQILTPASVLAPRAGEAGDERVVTVPLSDPSVLAVLRVGDRLDLLWVDSSTGEATMIAQGARVVALPQSDAGPLGGVTTSGTVLVAVSPADAVALARASVNGRIVPVWH